MDSDPRTALVQRLGYLHQLLQYIDAQWRAKAALGQRYQAPVPLKRRWRTWVVLLIAVGAGIVYIAGFTTFDAAIAILPAALLIGFLVLLLRNRVVVPKQHAIAERENERREQSNAAVRAEEQQIDGQLVQAGRDLAQRVGTDFYPEAYRHEEAVAFCAQAVQNHRANSITAALNLYETELHRRRVEDMHAAQLAEAQRATKMQAAGNVINAAMTGAAIGTIRAEGAATRRANAANASRVAEAAKQPRTVHVKKTGGIW
ncbi:hypothetical protein EB836_06455 [Brevibacterium sp. S111]|nr:hypothetical protein EB836_06455 [Brevibacterium sp. S111]